ncbi:MAG: cation-translocating P-type ATPase [Acidimicrobiia bacterium]|nr:cation-translocating P-type ATPase [Acidimicrobiia bacterium]
MTGSTVVPALDHAMTCGDVAVRLGVDPTRGLNRSEAAERLARHGPNELEKEPPTPLWHRVLAQFTDPLVILLLVAVAISLVVWLIEGADQVPFDAVVIAAILVLNAVIGLIQESRAQEAVDALQRMTLLEAVVRREPDAGGAAVEQPVLARDLVPGDVVILNEGDAVPADLRLVTIGGLEVAEAALTGESEAVSKQTEPVAEDAPLGDRRSMAYLGTAVTRGTATGMVTATGMATELGHIAGLLQEQPEEPTPLQREVALVGRFLGIGVVVIAIVVMAAIVATTDITGSADLVDVALVGVSLAVAAVPEGLPAILTVILAMGVQRMAERGAIVKKLASVETLGSASVICSDKTGTLTRNEMTVRRVVTASVDAEITGSGYAPIGEALVGEHRVSDRDALEEMRAVLAGGSLASDATLHHEVDAPADSGWTVIGDPTEGALLAARRKVGLRLEDVASRFTLAGGVPFDANRKMMTAVHVDADRGAATVFTKGAPDVLLSRCVAERVGSDERPLTETRRAEILATVDSLADHAYRSLAVAYRRLDHPHPEAVGERLDESIERDLTWSGVVGIFDPPRPEAAHAIDQAHRAGVRTVMITGDHPRTAVAIANELRLSNRPEAMIDGRLAVATGADIDRAIEAGDDALRRAIRRADVYARVTPEHKLRLVQALRADGHLVAMTGDGVNDAPALRSAEIGVAMGITGTDVSKGAADMILADDNYATIVAAVHEGRAVFSNIRKVLRYLLSSNVGEVFTMFFGVVLAGWIGLDAATDGSGEATLVVPLLATQILWINLLTDAFPALALGVDPPAPDLMARSPRRATDRLIDSRMISGIGMIGLVMAVVTLLALDWSLPGGFIEGHRSAEYGRTAAFTTLVLAQVFNAFNSRSDEKSAFPFLFTNRLLWAACGLAVGLQLAVVHIGVLNDAFDTAPLSWRSWLLCAVLASSVLWFDELRKLVVRIGRRRVSR